MLYFKINSKGQEKVDAWIGETKDAVESDHKVIGVNLTWRFIEV